MFERSSKPAILALLAALSLPIAAHVSAAQDNGDRISARGAAISGRGAAWSDGQRQVQKGQRLIVKSNKRTVDAEKTLERTRNEAAKAERQLQEALSDKIKGEQMISLGTARMQQAEAAYADIRNGPSAVAPQ